jgi:tetratricopeptide (TPR) repeat protein
VGHDGLGDRGMTEKWHDIAAQALSEIENGSAEIAVGLCEQVIFHMTEQHGEKSREAFRWRGWKGKALIEARRFVEAEELFGKLLEDRWVNLGPEDEETLSTRGNLAEAVARSGRPIEAISALQLLLDDRIRLFGPDARVVLTTLGKIAHMYDLAGNNAEAVRRYEELHSRQYDILGPDHPDLFVTESNLIVLKSKAKDENDLSQLEIFVEDCLLELGPEDPFLLIQQHHLASAYYNDGRFVEALATIKTVVEKRSQLFGPMDQRTIISIDFQSICKLALGDVDSAVLDLRNAIELWRAIGMENDQNSLQSQANLVNALLHNYTENSSVLGVELRQRVGQLVEGISKCEPDHHLKAWLAKVEQQYPELFVV